MHEVNRLNEKISFIGYTNMIHMVDLIMHRGDYVSFDIKKRKSIFHAIYQFSKRISVKYKTIIINKKYANNKRVLQRQIATEINKMIKDNELYFNSFDEIVMYYDNGQEILGTILDLIFYRFEGFKHRVEFDHVEKRLFQVSDMLTYIDKYDYKYKNRIPFKKGEKYFFTTDEIRKILNKKRF